MSIESVATTAQLAILESSVLAFREFSFQYLRANKNVVSIEYQSISQYFLVQLTKENLKLFISEDGYENFRQFQHKLLSSTYFQTKNDLRWNFYLIFLFDEDCDRANYSSLPKIENDEDFARKHFFSTSDAIDYLTKKDYFVQQDTSDLPINPMSEWTDILDEVQLTATLNTEFSSAVVTRYIYEQVPFNTLSFNNGIDRRIGTQSQQLMLKRVKEVEIGKYRKHCFPSQEKFKPKLINLLYGTNGSGKTSILESIECSLTGSVKRREDFQDASDYPIVKLLGIAGVGDVTFKSKQNSRIYKEIDNAWYGTPVGRNACTLNMNFNHFNSFNADSAYKFALEESRNENKYNDIFANLLFDATVISCQKNWLRYEKEFLERKTEIIRKLQVAQGECQRLEEEISSHSSSAVNWQDLDDILEKIQYKNPYALLESSEKYKKIHAVISTIKPVTKRLVEGLAKIAANSLNSVLQKKKIVCDKIECLYEEMDKKKSRHATELENIDHGNKAIFKLLQDKIIYGNLINRLKKSLETWNILSVIFSNPDKVKQYRELQNQQYELKERLSLLKRLMIQYPAIMNLSYGNLSCISEQEENAVKLEIVQTQADLSGLIGKLDELNQRLSSQRQIKIRLKTIATELLSSSNTIKNCPLCGIAHSDHESLINSIELEFNSTTDEQTFSSLQKEVTKHQQDLKRLQHIINTNDLNKQNIACIKKIAALLYDGCNSLLSEADQLTKVQKAFESYDTIALELETVSNLIVAMHEDGFSTENIEKANNFRETDEDYLQYVHTDAKESFSLYIERKMRDLEGKESTTATQIALEQEIIENSRKTIELINVDEFEQEIRELDAVQAIITQIENDYFQCNNYFEITAEDKLNTWVNNIETVSINIEIALKQLESINIVETKKKELAKLQIDRDGLEDSLHRCERVCDAFAKMPRLNDRVTNFVKSNKMRIQSFFKALHTPREFISLDIRDNRIVVIREQDRESITMYQMSTGQRTSLALALMFTLYLSASSAPKILLFDEPVANLDDLHLMNLIDILREFALNGTQIVFTTANPVVAGIFRRKFSFFGSDFNYFELNRYNLDKVQIKALKYSPYKEEGDIVKNLSK
ncbi:MAG: AAA family ATPase [Negativicutes bacterium]